MRRSWLVPAVAVSTLSGCGQVSVSPGSEVSVEACPPIATPSGRPQVDFDMPGYASVEELAAEADLVIRGRRIGCPELTHEASMSGYEHPAGEPGSPMAVYDVEVTQVVKGDPAQVVQVWALDSSRIDSGMRLDLPAGADVVLFLMWDPPESDYVIVGMDQGIIDVEADGGVRPRAEHLDTGGRSIEEIVTDLTG